jgi:trimethylamine:corrinoid methyltransferase-like protein
MAEYLAKGVDMSEYKLGLDSIKNVGPGGNFLVEDMTMDLLKSDEFFESEFFDMSGGYVDGVKGMYEIAHEKANALVANFKPTVPAKIQAAIKEFFHKRYQDKRVSDR